MVPLIKISFFIKSLQVSWRSECELFPGSFGLSAAYFTGFLLFLQLLCQRMGERKFLGFQLLCRDFARVAKRLKNWYNKKQSVIKQ
jgi:hypothetical protein